jgi:hypothetical protein
MRMYVVFCSVPVGSKGVIRHGTNKRTVMWGSQTHASFTDEVRIWTQFLKVT